MRTLFFATVIILLIAASCKKSPNTPTPPVNGGSITITSISPAMPYADDEITITGTGFNTDKTKDTVDFGGGDPVSGFFEPYIQGLGTTSKAVVISATATQLIIKAVNPDSTTTSGLNWSLFKGSNIGLNSVNRIRVRSNGLKTISNLTPFKQLPQLRIGTVAIAGIWQFGSSENTMRPNDSLEIKLLGVNSNGGCDNKITLSCSKVSQCSFVDNYVDVNGNSPQCNCDDFGTVIYGCSGNTFNGKLISYDPGLHLTVVHCLVPYNFFNTAYSTVHAANNNARILIKIKVENVDGKSFTSPVICYSYPAHP